MCHTPCKDVARTWYTPQGLQNALHQDIFVYTDTAWQLAWTGLHTDKKQMTPRFLPL